jgi:hypothetical protein
MRSCGVHLEFVIWWSIYVDSDFARRLRAEQEVLLNLEFVSSEELC